MNNRTGGEKVVCYIKGAPDLSREMWRMGYAAETRKSGVSDFWVRLGLRAAR
jgi:hypothetical protein